jgi:hypothetical protein
MSENRSLIKSRILAGVTVTADSNGIDVKVGEI